MEEERDDDEVEDKEEEDKDSEEKSKTEDVNSGEDEDIGTVKKTREIQGEYTNQEKPSKTELI